MSACGCRKTCRLWLWELELKKGGEYSGQAQAAIAALAPVCELRLQQQRAESARIDAALKEGK